MVKKQTVALSASAGQITGFKKHENPYELQILTLERKTKHE